jgi:hypothetical protein
MGLPRLCRWVGIVGVLAAGALAASSSLAAAAPTTCSGTFGSPGILAGDYGSVRVEGVCAVKQGPARVHGTLTLTPGSALGAIFAADNSSLSVYGNVVVQSGATLFLGCEPGHFTCKDDPNQEHPTLFSHGLITGDLIETAPLGVIVHASTIGGSVTEVGGGGGVNCNPTGIFDAIHSPVYSDYEDTTIGGRLSVGWLNSCWLGVARVQISGRAMFSHVQLADPDGIEIIDNHIGGDLACYDNSHVWDSADISPTGALYPRQPEPNTVGGARLGQCVLASPPTDSSPPGPGPF